MTAKALVDTNILVYAQDLRDPARRRRSQTLLEELSLAGTGLVSTQAMQEFFSIATKKLGLTPLAAKAVMRSWTMAIVPVTPEVIFDATDGVMTEQISWWDSLMISAARAANCGTLYSEDLQHGQIVRGIRVLNPFAPPPRTRPR